MVKVVKLQSFGSGNGAVDTLGVEPKGYVNSGTDEDTGHGRKLFEGQSIHGDTAAKRRAITELLFFASVGDVRRMQRIVRIWGLVIADPSCCDYDRRTPLHLAASEGAYKATEWLLSQNADINVLDRFRRTPLEDAVRGEHREVAKLLSDNGGRVLEEGNLVDLGTSKLAGAMGLAPQSLAVDFDPEWELTQSNIQILEKLGEGEFGVVYKARWHGSLVAAKILKGSSDIALGDFRGEIDILRKVHHPNAVQFLGACTKKEPYILVTELMAGGSLADAFRRPEAFPLRRSVEIALDAARGLAYLHNRRPSPIIHRDLKPGNLMLSGSQYQSQRQIVFDTGIVKLADFGLSKTLPSNKHADHNLDDKFRLTGETGSYRYMAPEVFRHEPYNSSVDVYSYSMIMFQLFEFQPPFAGIDPIEAARQAALYDLRPNFVSLLQPGLAVKGKIRTLIEACWAANAGDRPTFETVVERLEEILTSLPRNNKSSSGGGDGCCVVS